MPRCGWPQRRRRARASICQLHQNKTKKSTWARSFYDQQRNRNKSHHAAVRALSFKWIRIVFRCWKDRVPYDETRYTLSLQQRSTPKNVEIRVKNFYGFAQFDGLSC